MKARIPLYFATTLLAVTPVVSHAETADSIQQCIAEFAEQYFPNQSIESVVRETAEFPTPLIAQTGTQTVKLVATGKSSGREYATAMCDVKGTGIKSGTVTVLLVE